MWRFYSYDLWKTAEGWEVNDVYKTNVTGNTPEEVMADYYTDPSPYERNDNIDNEDIVYYFRKDDGCPVCEVRREDVE